jgi:hypothetical protein
MIPIDPTNGLITWNSLIVGNAQVEVKVTDTGGLARQGSKEGNRKLAIGVR